MLPVLAWIVVGAVASAVTATVVLRWDSILIALKGKKVAVLGARGVGKTHLIQFLTSGSIPAEYKQTLVPDPASERRFKLKELDLKIKETRDVSGAKEAYSEWKELFMEADVVFYLLRADLINIGDKKIEKRVENDLQHIKDWLEEKSPQFFLIGTHCDLDPLYPTSDGRRGDYQDKFLNLPIVQKLIRLGGGSSKVKLILGSMKTKQDTEALVHTIFSAYVK